MIWRRPPDDPRPEFLRGESYRLERERQVAFRSSLFASLYCIVANRLLGGGWDVGIKLVLFFAIPLSQVNRGVSWLTGRLKRSPPWVAVATLSVCYTLVITLAYMAIVLIVDLKGPSLGRAFEWVALRAKFIYPAFMGWVAILYFIRGINSKIGPGVFLRWLGGYYLRPRREERIFLFLDMRDSTAIAEKVGAEQFGRLLSDFMADLGDSVGGTKGEVSHYIGDEAVITWPIDRGLQEARCIQCFYRFQTYLQGREQRYLAQYGLMPKFKAGMHCGEVVATEVGEFKSEIVYLGDVVNTAARIQGACNDLGSDFLVSADLARRLPSLAWLAFDDVGPVELKGKAEAVPLMRPRLTTDRSAEALADRV